MKPKVVRDPQPPFERGDVVNVEGVGEGLTVLSLKPGAECWWIECRMDDGRTWAVPQDRVWR